MLTEIVISGSGGQGVLVIGRLLAETGFLEGREVMWAPSYSAEKRGGTVSCSVTVSDEKIGALVITHPNIGIAMNLSAGIKLEPKIKAGGWLLVNQAKCDYEPSRSDIHFLSVPANHIAQEINSDSTANIVALGALISIYPIVSLNGVVMAMDQLFGNKTLEMNKHALMKGSFWVKNNGEKN